jgi:N6-adenosine-specific RNA methylase IME4
MYSTLLIDPPWRYSSPGWLGGAHRHYSTLPFEALVDMPVAAVADNPSHLWVWATKDHREDAESLVDRWGYDLRATWHWVKLTKNPLSPSEAKKRAERMQTLIQYKGEIHGLAWGMGYYNRGATEYLLLATKGKTGIKSDHKGRQVRDVILAPIREHSQKPEEAYELIRNYSPPKRLELFGRNRHYGFFQWGDGAEKPTKLPALDDWGEWAEEHFPDPRRVL